MSSVSQGDRDITRRLAARVAEIASLPRQQETIRCWRGLNALKPIRPMVYVYQLPWRELTPLGDVGPQCEDPVCRRIEESLSRIVYQWDRFPVDQVVEPVFTVPYVINSTGVGFDAHMTEIPHDTDGGVTSKHYDAQIETEADVLKIVSPVISCDWERTEATFQKVQGLIGDILHVRKEGRVVHNYAPWDRLAEWWNPQQLLMDLILRPELIHLAMERLTAAYMSELDQLEEQGLLSLGSGNSIVGQGGLGFIDELPRSGCDPDHVGLADQWGGAMAQIFSEVSPDMHEEFALAYESRYLERFGLSYYGCCEPLDRKVDIAAKHIPNLRKISMSPWVVAERGAAAIGGRFVFSFKPNPAFLATDRDWDEKSAKAQIEHVLDVTRGTSVEIILKDVSTLRFEPRRIQEWADMVMSLVRQ